MQGERRWLRHRLLRYGRSETLSVFFASSRKCLEYSRHSQVVQVPGGSRRVGSEDVREVVVQKCLYMGTNNVQVEPLRLIAAVEPYPSMIKVDLSPGMPCSFSAD